MSRHPLISYFVILILLCAAIIFGARSMGEQGAYLAQFYKWTRAIAALITRQFFYEPKFSDACLGFGRWRDYLKYWLAAIGITFLSYGFFTLLGSVTWDFTGKVFLDRLAEQFAATGQNMNTSLPEGFTPLTMLVIYTIGGLTVFNIFPGIITGFGEEFGHRGFMFPQLYRIKPWVGLIIGGLIWYTWHLPLGLVLPQSIEPLTWQAVMNYLILAVGSVCTFIFLAYVYVKSGSVWVTALTHITLNNSASAFSYYVVIQNQLLANLGLTLTMLAVVAFLYYRKELDVFRTQKVIT